MTLVLATRSQSHRFVSKLNTTDVQAFARYVVIAAAVLPFLPNRQVGPLAAWNPFQLWLVVVLITGFSFLGYIADRTIGERRGVLATALIGGYSSTAVTASFSQRLGAGEAGPLTAGILHRHRRHVPSGHDAGRGLVPSTLLPFVAVTAPAALIAWVRPRLAWFRAPQRRGGNNQQLTNPIELLPPSDLPAIVAVGVLATRWAQVISAARASPAPCSSRAPSTSMPRS